ncbi:MAG TPA: hypothetical protein PLZ29_11530, partial [Spirochaetota bacterium]|nr:hypothetical protein [Spirochaetota bacterium]
HKEKKIDIKYTIKIELDLFAISLRLIVILYEYVIVQNTLKVLFQCVLLFSMRLLLWKACNTLHGYRLISLPATWLMFLPG